MAELMRQVEISSFSGPNLDERRDICVGESFRSAMTLDMVSAAAKRLSQPFSNRRLLMFADHPVVHVCGYGDLLSQGRRAGGLVRVLHRNR